MKERQKFIIMLLVCFGIAMGVQYIFNPPKDAPREQPTAESDDGKGSPDGAAETAEDKGPGGEGSAADEGSPGGADADAADAQPDGSDAAEPDIPQIVEAPPETNPKTVKLDNEYLQIELDNHGAVLSKLRITGKDGLRYEIDLLGYASDELPKLKDIAQPPSLVLSDTNGLMIRDALWRWANEADKNPYVAVFVLEKSGIRITKTFDITPGEKPSTRYGVRLKIKIENIDSEKLTALNLDLRGAGSIGMCDVTTPIISGHMGIRLSEGHKAYNESAAALFGILSDEEDRKKDREDYDKSDVAVEWVAVTNKYFVAALIPLAGFPAQAEAYMYPTQGLNEKYDERKCSVEAGVRWNASLPKPGEAAEVDFVFLTTSREKESLAEFKDIGMIDLVEDGGFFSFVAIPIVLVLKGINSLGLGYGWAILILTAFIRVAMFPLSRKQQMLQYKNQRLAPHLKQIKQKHKNDRAKIQEETMKLYSKHGINPLMGCLPMLIQLPILFGLFSALRTAIDLRKAAFLYIPDLSIADGAGLGWLLNWSFLGIKTFYYINPLAIAMGLVYFLYMKTTPKTNTDDPQQQSMQKMMKFMPLMMFVLLYNYAAGLALYITFGAIVGIFENKIARRMVEAELERNPIEAPVTPAKQVKKKK